MPSSSLVEVEVEVEVAVGDDVEVRVEVEVRVRHSLDGVQILFRVGGWVGGWRNED